MKRTLLPAAVVFLLSGCATLNTDAGPTLTANDEIDAGKAEAVRAEIHMGGGDLHLKGGGAKLLTASYRYSESIGRPVVHYDVTGSRGQLTVESPKRSASIGNKVNEWTLQMGSDKPLELNINLGGGQADLDLSGLPLDSVDVNVAAGELDLNVAGNYKKDVTVHVNGGAGESRIHLARDMGAVVEAHVGLGGVNANGLTKRDDGKYYNAAFAEGKPTVRMNVQGGVGEITLSVGK